MKPYWITFYSYKGGVGRSLALANLAALLVQRGRRVVLIDFDLEAPGLDSFKEFAPSSAMPGVVEYVAEFERTHVAPDITTYVHPCILPDDPRGQLWVMPAGKKDKAYNQLRVKIDWVKLYDEKHGAEFIENWKASVFEAFNPDYVLVDSRTGLTDIGGICTLHLPDLVVLLFGLNEQNIKGIASVAQAIREGANARIPQMLAVATPVPLLLKEESKLLRDRLEKATALLKIDNISQISYFPQAALAERLFVLDTDSQQSSVLEYEYDELLTQCLNLNRNGIDFLIEKAEETVNALDQTRGQQIASVLVKEFPDRAEAFYWSARVQRSSGKTKDAIESAERALNLDPAYSRSLELLQELTANSPFKLLDILDRLLKNRKSIDAGVLDDIYRIKGDVSMQMEDYPQAADAFSSKFALPAQDKDLLDTMVDSFNFLESLRRATGEVNTRLWKKVINVYESFESSGAKKPLEGVANRCQAMHIAYACVGLLEKALASLSRAESIANNLGVVDQVFCVASYRYVSPSEFVKMNRKMVLALQNGMLWDGMKIKVAKKKRNRPKSKG